MNCHLRAPSTRRLSLQISRFKEQPREMMMGEDEVDEEDNGQSNVISNFAVPVGETDLKQQQQQVVVVVEDEETTANDAKVHGASTGYSAATISDVRPTVPVVNSVGINVGVNRGSSNRPGYLTPDLHIVSPPSFPKKGGNFPPCVVGKYILLDQLDEKPLYKCVNIDNEQEYTCKIVNNENEQTLALYYRVDCHERLNELVEVLRGERHSYLIFERSFGDLHSYVRSRRRLKEAEAVRLFRQVIEAVQHCHNNGIVLRDLKLRKFVFKDPQRTMLKLETLEDAVSVEDDNDTLDDKHGCPAYVSPEILTTNGGYSGKAADVWSMGVMLYAMLVGRYPFHDTEHSTLFNKIRGGHYVIPDTISSKAKCLIRCLLRHNPSERLMVDDILRHPWFSSNSSSSSGSCGRVQETRPNAINVSVSTTMTTTIAANNNTTTGLNKFGDQLVPDCGIVLLNNKKPTGWD